MIYLSSQHWTACRKFPMTVYVRRPKTGEQPCFSRAGLALQADDDLIVRDPQGKTWPVGYEIFEQTYDLLEPLQDNWTACRKRPVTIHVKLPYVGQTKIETREGVVSIGNHDVILRGIQGECFPLHRSVFQATYYLVE